MYCCKKNSCFCLMLTLFRCPLITENKHLYVTRNCQIYIMPLDTLKKGNNKLNEFMYCIKFKRNNLLNSIYSSVFPEFSFKETPFTNFFTDPQLSSSLYILFHLVIPEFFMSGGVCYFLVKTLVLIPCSAPHNPCLMTS